MTTRSTITALLSATLLTLAALPAQASLYSLSAGGIITFNSTGDPTIPLNTPFAFQLTYDTAAPDLDFQALGSPDPTYGRFNNTAAPPALTFFHFKAGTYEVTLNTPADFASGEMLITFTTVNAIDINISAPTLFPHLAGGPVSFHADFNAFSTAPIFTSDGLPTNTTLVPASFDQSSVTLLPPAGVVTTSNITTFAITVVPAIWLNTTNANNAWSTPANWSAGTPTSLTDIFFNANATYTAVIDPGATCNSMSVTAGKVTLDLSGHSLTIVQALNLSSGAALILTQPISPGAVKTSSLTLAGVTSNWTASLDLSNGALIVQATTAHAAALSTLQNQLTYATVATGIFSSSTAADPTHKITVAVDNALLGLTQFAGLPVDANSLLLESTWLGDANLDRKVDVTDLGTLATHYGQSVPNALLQGDFNNDGKVDVTDLGLLATNYGAGSAAFPLQPTPVPEPSTALLILGLLTPLLATRRPPHSPHQ